MWYLDDPDRLHSREGSLFFVTLSYIMPSNFVAALAALQDLYEHLKTTGLTDPKAIQEEFRWGREGADDSPIFSLQQAKRIAAFVKAGSDPHAWLAAARESKIQPIAHPSFEGTASQLMRDLPGHLEELAKRHQTGGGMLSGTPPVIPESVYKFVEEWVPSMTPDVRFLVDNKDVVLLFDVGETFLFWAFELESIFPEAGLAFDFLNASAPAINETLQETIPIVTSPLLALAGAGAVIDMVTFAVSAMFSLWLASVNLSRRRFSEAFVQAIGAFPLLGPTVTQMYNNVAALEEKFEATRSKLSGFSDRVLSLPRKLSASYSKVQDAMGSMMGVSGQLMSQVKGLPGGLAAVSHVIPDDVLEKVRTVLPPALTDSEIHRGLLSKIAAPAPPAGGHRRRPARTRRIRRHR